MTGTPEADYNVRLLHPERQTYYSAFASASAATRRRLSCRLDLPYGPAPRQRLDLFPGRPGAPLITFIHGGFWHSHDKSEFSFVAGPLVAAGATVVLPSYGLAPSTPLPAIVDQLRTALYWTQAEGSRLGCDPERHFIAGHSAGAHLAACLLLAEPRLRGACLISGIYSLAPLLETTLAAQIGLDQSTAESCSLAGQLRPHPGAALIAVGSEESAGFRAQSAEFLAAWRGAGNEGEPLTVPAANHYTILQSLQDGSEPLTRRLVAFAAA